MRDQEEVQAAEVQFVRVTLHERGFAGDEGAAHTAAFVVEHAVDVEAVKAIALKFGWGVTIEIAMATACGGDGRREIERFVEDADTGETKNDPASARMNKIERDLSSLQKSVAHGFQDLKNLIADAVQAGGSVRRVDDAELQRAAYVAGARLTPPPSALAPSLASVSADEPQPTHRRDTPMRTPEMQGNPDHKSNSMALVGPSAGSTIYSTEAGFDDDGLPKKSALPRVGNTLHRGTKLTGE